MTQLNNPDILKAAVIVIGNEILSGRTQDTNTQWIAENLLRHGIMLAEARIVPDIEEKIIEAVNALRSQVDYVFTTGGIGPTHDDITASSVAKAFGLGLERNDEAFRMLELHYGIEEITPARAKMCLVPVGSKLIPNPVSGAPGFIVGNVYVMAGIPRIMRAMLDHVMADLKPGKQLLSNTVSCSLPESVLSEPLEALQKKYPQIDMGSYPHFRAGTFGVNLVLRGTDANLLKFATREVIQMVTDLGDEPQAMGLQVMVDD
jgi:molybdenum cofactor synthesis domain-containing protein